MKQKALKTLTAVEVLLVMGILFSPGDKSTVLCLSAGLVAIVILLILVGVTSKPFNE